VAPQTEPVALEARPYLTAREVAERLQVSDDTVRNYCKSGQLEHIRPGGRTFRISPEALDRFEAAQRAAVAARLEAEAQAALAESIAAGRLPESLPAEARGQIAQILRQHRREQARKTPVG
jgi:excisionase family DNA binding protein